MKVGLLTSFYPEIHGGAEVSLGVLLDGLKRMGQDSVLFTTSNRQSTMNGKMIKVSHLGFTPKFVRISGFPGLNSIFARALTKSLRDHGIDLLHVNDTYALRAAARAAERVGIPLVLSYHNNLNIPYSSYGTPYPLSSWLDSREKGVLTAAAKCSMVIADSDYVAGRLLDAGLNPDSVKRIYIDGAVSEWGTPPALSDRRAIRVLSAGIMQYHKGFQDVLFAIKQLVGRGASPEVVLAGDGPYRNRLLHLAKRLSLMNEVKFVCRVGHQKLLQFYDWCDVVVVPTITPEPFGRVAVEAMSRGRPVIGTNGGGLAEIIDDELTGFLVPPGDSSAIAEKILTFRNQPSLGIEMGRRGLEKCKVVFDQSTIANQVINIYHMLVPNS